MSTTQILFTSLIVWRISRLIVSDFLFSELKEWFCGKLGGRTETYMTVLLYCIYCMTFWGTLIVYATLFYDSHAGWKEKLYEIFTIWAISTLVGATHNLYSKETSE